MLKKYVVAKYLRLSSDDGNDIESNSIANQRDLLNDYIENNFDDIDIIELSDDGFSGTNFNRPSVKKLISLAEAKKIDCIIVKDFSRFGRDYIEVGKYLENKFPELQIRFISVNDDYDSNNYRGITSGIETAIKNLAYSMYSQDLSEKVKSAIKIRKKKGEFLSPFAFYGYVKDPNNKNRIIIDDEAAAVVKRIFEMRASGISNKKIAIKLNEENILSPSLYKTSKDPLCRKWNTKGDYSFWSPAILGNILSDERYTGKMVSGKIKRASVGSSKMKLVDKKDWLIVENTHEPIISEELFEKVRKIRMPDDNGKISEFSLKGLLYCGDCRHKLDFYGRNNKNITCFCGYRDFTKSNGCLQMNVRETEIIDALSTVIKEYINKVIDFDKVLKDRKKINKAKPVIERNQKIDILKEQRLEAYKQFTISKLTEQQFFEKRDKINTQISALETETLKESTEIEQETLIDSFKKYEGIQNINRGIIDNLIQAIYVHSDKKLEIIWKFNDTNIFSTGIAEK